MKHISRVLLSFFFAVTVAWGAKPGSGRAAIGIRSADPYLGAIVVDAVSGTTLFEDKADASCYPASVVKLMVLLLMEERIDAGLMALTDPVQVTPEAAAIGGSQVFLDPKEVFPVEELIAAMSIHSANDAAAALAIHVTGSRNAFVDLMNKRAVELGMNATRFHSVHGLPPADGQEPDVSTARDLSLLAREILLKHPDVTQISSQQNRPFRNGAFSLRNPNHLLGSFPGCDGLKTGYFRAGGFSIVATAVRNGRRVIAVVTGCADGKVRDATAKDLLSKGFIAQESLPPPVVVSTTPAAADITKEAPAASLDAVVTNSVPTNNTVPSAETKPARHHPLRLGIAVLLAFGIGVAYWRRRGPRR